MATNLKPFNCVIAILMLICAIVAVSFVNIKSTVALSQDAAPVKDNKHASANHESIAVRLQKRNVKVKSVLDGINSRGADDLSVASWKPTVAVSSRSDALDSLTGGDLVPAAGEKKYMLVKKKPKHKKVKMEVMEPKMKYKKIKMKVPVKVMKKKKVKGYMVKKHHEHHY